MTINEIEAIVINLLPPELGLITAYVAEDDGPLRLIIEGPDAPRQRMALHDAGFFCIAKDRSKWESQPITLDGFGLDRYTKALKSARWRKLESR